MINWRGNDIARAFTIPEEGSVLNGVFCLNTELGLATPSLYRGDLQFLQWLGTELPQMSSRLGRLSLSRLLSTPAGRYYAELDGEHVILSTWENGPTCDPHNTFELFTIAAGLAHVHEHTISERIAQSPNWLAYYRSQQDKVNALNLPTLNKRAQSAWTLLADTWRLCVEEAVNLLVESEDLPSRPCVTLGLDGFNDFIYLADRHYVHFNQIAGCRIDSAAVDIAKLLISAAGDTRIASNILLCYQRVRQISPREGKELLAHLWYPHGIDLPALAEGAVNPLSSQRAYNDLLDKIAIISELEDVLPAANVHVGLRQEEEVLLVSKKDKVKVEKNLENLPADCVDSPQEDTEVMMDEPIVIEVAAEEISREESKTEPDDAIEVTGDAPTRIRIETTTTKPLPVWGPFPQSLNAPVLKEIKEEMPLADDLAESPADAPEPV